MVGEFFTGVVALVGAGLAVYVLLKLVFNTQTVDGKPDSSEDDDDYEQ